MMQTKNTDSKTVYPYVPNSAPAVQKEMMDFVGVKDLWELYEEIPDDLKYFDKLDIPAAILDEYSLKNHTVELLEKNGNCIEYTSFLGAGCAQHFIPAVVDEITSRGEFLTCYGAESWADHGKYQAFFEYNSMLCALLGAEAISVPQYDGGQAAASALRMANRINDRKKVLLPYTMNPQNKRIIENYLASVQKDLAIRVEYIDYDRNTGRIDLDDLERKLDDSVAAVLVENPGFHGVLEPMAEKIGEMAKAAGAEYIVYVNPLSLGILEAPVNYGANIVCGDLHGLGLHLSFGNGQAGFFSTLSEPKYLNENKDFIYGMCEPEVEGEHVFGNLLIERTHYAQRAKGKEYTGTGTNLWMISAAVYMALMGPKGMREVGETILYNSRYAAKRLNGLPGVSLQFSGDFFQEFVLNFDGTGKTVAEINERLLERKIFGGVDLSKDFPQYGQSALYAVTEVTGKAKIDKLVTALNEILE